MNRQPIPANELVLPPLDVWSTNWMLLTAGRLEPRGFNSMTVGWGTLGVMWGRPAAVCVVRPTRYTYGFMEQSPDFTLCVLPPQFRDVLNMLGTKSGRDTDKIAESGLTPIASGSVQSPAYAEAELIIECRKLYYDDIEPTRFLDPDIHGFYNNDYHRLYLGEIVAVQGTEHYRRRA